MKLSRKIKVFLIMSFVSLFADMTYEGARSVGGSYLEYLSASIFFAGLLSAGDLLSYMVRALSGILISKVRTNTVIWGTTILGYVINLISVPLLAFTGNWQLAFLLYMTERIGKGLRAPSRDVILSELISELPTGKGFGIHEFLDQLGAISGPLIVAYYLSNREGFSIAFEVLSIPATIAIVLILLARLLYPKLEAVKTSRKLSYRLIPGKFRLFIISVSLISFGFAQWGIISYRIAQTPIETDYIPLLYSLAMLMDAIFAIPLGMFYDKYDLAVLLPIPLLSIFSTVTLLSSANVYLLVVGASVWGIVTAYYETVFRAAVSNLAKEDIAGGFGVYSVTQAVTLFLGSIIIAAIMAYYPNILTHYIVFINAMSLLFMLFTAKRSSL